jgi:hypothetical protein
MSVFLAIGSTLLWILLWLLLGLLALLATLVVFPFTVQVAGSIDDDEVFATARVNWLLGLVGVEASSQQGMTLRLFGLRTWRFRAGTYDDEKAARRRKKRQDKKAKKAELKRDKKKSKKKEHALSPLERVRAVLAYRGFMWRFASRVLATFALRGRVGGLIGTGDPVETLSLRAAVLTLEQRTQALELELDFDYIDDVIDVWAEAYGRLWLAHIVWVLMLYVAKRDTWRLWRIARA